MQSTNSILMIRPVNFRSNEQTMESNAFQKSTALDHLEINDQALKEFDEFVVRLRAAQINVLVVNDTMKPETPDSIFPNNWISFHNDATVVLYPMMVSNRRLERRPELITLLQNAGFRHDRIVDLSKFEKENKFLEGTGSMVLDRDNKIAYACLSPRTNAEVLDVFCKELKFKKVIFNAVDAHFKPIYHTNVMMCVGSSFVIACLESIHDQAEREEFVQSVNDSGKSLFDITYKQMEHFAGNMLEVRSLDNKLFLVMSTNAYHSLEHLAGILNKICTIIHSPLDVIERNGGGSARCMMAEIHLPQEV